MSAGEGTQGIVANWITRRGRRTRVLFVVVNGLSYACQEPVLRLLEDDPRFHVAVAHRQRAHFKRLRFDEPESERRFRRHFLPWQLARWLPWDIVLATDHPSPRPRWPTLQVSMGHGGMFGNNEMTLRLADDPRVDVVFGLSEAERSFVERRAPQILAAGRRFFAVGSPKCDALARGEIDGAATLARLGLPPDRPAVLIVSHWTPGALLLTYGARLVERLARAYPEVSFLQTGHNMLWEAPAARSPDYPSAQFRFGRRESEALWAELEAVARARSNVRVLRASRIEPLMAASSMLVVDHSSALATYAVLDRPILQHQDPSVPWYDADIRALCASAALGFCTLDELEPLVARALRDPAERSAQRRLVRESFLANPGRGAEAAAAALLDLRPAACRARPRRERSEASARSEPIPRRAGQLQRSTESRRL